jgi:predicted enzyme related to lactoylglutathione lyase
MERVTGIGGVFFKSPDPAALKRWYADRLGVPLEHDNIAFTWEDPHHPKREGMTVLGMFSKDTKYFGTGPAPFMVNFRVRDLDAMAAQLKASGAQVDDIQDTEYGRFAWVTDPDGNRVELWEPPDAR